MAAENFLNIWVNENNLTDWNRGNHVIVPATYFREDNLEGEECENKVVIGRLLAVNSPDQSGNHYGYQVSARPTAVVGSGAKKPKIGAGKYTGYKYMLVFADQMNLPSCFTIILQNKADFQKLFSYIDVSHEVSVGDLLAIVEPTPADAVLGENMTILEQPYLLITLKEHIRAWPQSDLQMSDTANQQRAFYKTGRRIQCSLIRLLGKGQINCSNVTCDRQRLRCSGCFGTKQTINPIVLQCNVKIFGSPNYDKSNSSEFAHFRQFRSFRFSKIFFESISQLSARTLQSSRATDIICQERIPQMVAHVNDHGGWTVAGWHRRGVRTTSSGDSEDTTLSVTTLGHLTLLVPTNRMVVSSEAFKTFLIPTNYEDESGGDQAGSDSD